MSNDITFSEGFLFSGKDLFLDKNVIVKHPSIENILSITNDETSFDIYWNMVNTLMCDPYTHMVMLDDLGIDYEKIDAFDVFVLKWKDLIKQYQDDKQKFDALGIHPLYNVLVSLSFFLGEHNFELCRLENEDGELETILCDKNSIEDGICYYMINRNMFNRMAEFICSIHHIDKSDQIHPENDNFKKMLIEDMRDELKSKSRKKQDTKNTFGEYIGKIMKATCSCGNGGISVFNVNDVKIYQLLSGFNMFVKKNSVDRLFNGQYDLSKLNQKELNWFD